MTINAFASSSRSFFFSFPLFSRFSFLVFVFSFVALSFSHLGSGAQDFLFKDVLWVIFSFDESNTSQGP
jgi:hypothetical protein